MGTDRNTKNKAANERVAAVGEEADEETVVADEEAAGDAVGKLRAKLKECERERKEYLDGWKRSKADAVNERKRQRVLAETERAAALGQYALAMLPVLDSINAAADEVTDSAVRSGIERIRAQCMRSFAGIGVEILNPAGMPFDPHRHQAVGERPVDDAGKGDTVVEVARVGALAGDVVLRAAMVYVGRYEDGAEKGGAAKDGKDGAAGETDARNGTAAKDGKDGATGETDARDGTAEGLKSEK